MDVSVICPAFNTDPVLIAVAIRSVLDQAGSYTREIVLVDDNSTNLATHGICYQQF